MKRNRAFRIKQTAIILLMASVGLVVEASAQDSPPPHVVRSVDAVMKLLGSTGDGPIERFIDQAMKPTTIGDRAALVSDLKSIRNDIDNLTDDISIEAEADGVRMILRGRGEMKQLRVILDEDGISALRLLEAGPESPRTDRAGVTDQHLASLEGLVHADINQVIDTFEQEHFSADYLRRTTRPERRALLESIKEAVQQAGGILIGERGETAFLELRGRRTNEVRITVEPEAPFGINSLEIEDVGDRAESLVLTPDNLDETMQRLSANGFSGSIHVRLGGKVLLERGYGTANAKLETSIGPKTAFGIGSTPIDFTIVAIYLLAQRGQIQLDASIADYLEGVPLDKKSITLQHLLEGRSGLSDFHGTSADWDQDLAWIDRATAIRRILDEPLLFAPGTSRAHSHSAFGLLAAVVEVVSGQDYYSFVKNNFFDPAGMTRTGMNGTTNGLMLSDFAEGNGTSSIGLPNIPPNWGPTSWLVLGSGGMYSTLEDLLAFYQYIRTGGVLEAQYSNRYQGSGVGIGGSVRGFYVFHAYNGGDDEAMIVTNIDPPSADTRALTRALERLVEGNDCEECGN